MVASANMWVKFFQAAGVPSAAAATYAHIFHENRMDLDMLTDLNKEYLREMGITPMGDIISILRHAKKVYEQNTRDKILSGEKQLISTASVSPLVASTISKRHHSRNDDDEKMEESNPSQSKPARRVLPEHEGRYKVTLPAGTTERSKQILAKRAMLYSDKQEVKPAGIFDRLEQIKSEPSHKMQRIKVTTMNEPSVSASIFARLGEKSLDDDMGEEELAFAGLIKSGPRKIVGIKKATKVQPKTIIVKKIPAKAATMVADEYESRMETGEKSVKFASVDEMIEIESRRQLIARNKRLRLNEANNVKARLGLNSKNNVPSPKQTVAALQRAKKIIKLKQPVKRSNGQVLNVSALRSDEATKSVKSRLALKKGLTDDRSVKKIVDRIGRVSLKSRLGKSKPMANGNSVFDRLGFNKK